MTTIDEGVGAARSSGPSVQDLLASDSRRVPESLKDHSYVPQGSADIPKIRYTSNAFAALENEYLWTRTWQMACTNLFNPGITWSTTSPINPCW
jgi:hypothetical protein